MTLITGARGFIGSNLARRLPNAIHLTTDLRDRASLEDLFAKHRIRTVYHLAAYGVRAEESDSALMTEVNTLGAFALGEIALKYGVERFVYSGSALDSSSAYGASKAAGWFLLDYLRRAAGLPLVTARLFSVYGPAESKTKLIPWVISKALRREPIELSSGVHVRDYLYVSDAVDALLLAAGSNARPGDVFDVGAGPKEARTVRSIVEATLDLMGAPRSLCRFGEVSRSRVDPPRLVSDPSLTWSGLGWQPRVAFEHGLRNTIRWYENA